MGKGKSEGAKGEGKSEGAKGEIQSRRLKKGREKLRLEFRNMIQDTGQQVSLFFSSAKIGRKEYFFARNSEKTELVP
jgi:hypothetical protein